MVGNIRHAVIVGQRAERYGHLRIAVEDVVVAAIFKAQAHALRRGRTMNDDKRDDSHRPMQEVRPNTPASAVATAMIDLRTMPHTDFDFVAIMI